MVTVPISVVSLDRSQVRPLGLLALLVLRRGCSSRLQFGHLADRDVPPGIAVRAPISGSVVTWIAIGPVAAFAVLIAFSSSALLWTSMTSTPRLRTFAARSTGRWSPSSLPPPLRRRYAVPNRCDPSDSESAPIEANPYSGPGRR